MPKKYFLRLTHGPHVDHIPLEEGGTELVTHRAGACLSSPKPLHRMFANKFKRITEEEFHAAQKALKASPGGKHPARDATATAIHPDDEGFEVEDPKASGEDNPEKPSDAKKDKDGNPVKKKKKKKKPSLLKERQAAAGETDDGENDLDEESQEEEESDGSHEEDNETAEEQEDKNETSDTHTPKKKKKKKKPAAE